MNTLQTDTLSAPTDSLAVSSLQLGNLHEPAPVPFTFDTIGWPILAGLLVVFIFFITIFQIRKYIRNHYRREALRMLEDIHSGDQDFSKTFIVLKQVAIHVFGRKEVGDLFGKEWLSFLEKTGKDVQLVTYELPIMNILYKNEMPASDVKDKIIDNAKKWIKTHAR